VLLLADLAGGRALDVGDDSLVAFDLGADDAEAVEGDDWLLGLLRLLGLLGALRTASGIFRRGGWIGVVGIGVDLLRFA
jgi:hypothetical protein